MNSGKDPHQAGRERGLPPARSQALSRAFRRALFALGAALLLGIAALAALWATAGRAPEGEIPLIAAPQEPARIAPPNPGGEIADHLGLAVSALSEGEARPQGRAISLAPPPMDLEEEDAAGTARLPGVLRPLAQDAPWQAELGAFDALGQGRAQWELLAQRFGALFEGKSMVAFPDDLNGNAFFRLRVKGFQTDDEAQDFCAALRAERTDCIVVAPE